MFYYTPNDEIIRPAKIASSESYDEVIETESRQYRFEGRAMSGSWKYLNLSNLDEETTNQAFSQISIIRHNLSLSFFQIFRIRKKPDPASYFPNLLIDDKTRLSDEHTELLKSYLEEGLQLSVFIDTYKEEGKLLFEDLNKGDFSQVPLLNELRGYLDQVYLCDRMFIPDFKQWHLAHFKSEKNYREMLQNSEFEEFEEEDRDYIGTVFLLWTCALFFLSLTIMLTPGIFNALLVVPAAAWYASTALIVIIGFVGRHIFPKRTFSANIVIAVASLLMACYLFTASSPVVLLGAMIWVTISQLSALLILIFGDQRAFIDNKIIQWVSLIIPVAMAVIVLSVTLSPLWAQVFVQMPQPNALLWAGLLITSYLMFAIIDCALVGYKLHKLKHLIGDLENSLIENKSATPPPPPQAMEQNLTLLSNPQNNNLSEGQKQIVDDEIQDFLESLSNNDFDKNQRYESRDGPPVAMKIKEFCQAIFKQLEKELIYLVKEGHLKLNHVDFPKYLDDINVFIIIRDPADQSLCTSILDYMKDNKDLVGDNRDVSINPSIPY